MGSRKWALVRSPVLARERVPLGLGHVLVRSPKWALVRSQVLARERVPLGLSHVLSRRLKQTLGLPAVRGGQQGPGVEGTRRETREAPPMKCQRYTLKSSHVLTLLDYYKLAALLVTGISAP